MKRGEWKARHYVSVYNRAYLKCVFQPQLHSEDMVDPWKRARFIRRQFYTKLDSVPSCRVHSESFDGCYCPSTTTSHGQSSRFCLTIIKQAAEKELKNLMKTWSEFIRRRYFTEGPISCERRGVYITAAEIYIENMYTDEDAVTEHIRTFDCS
jgi:hypothetical protein